MSDTQGGDALVSEVLGDKPNGDAKWSERLKFALNYRPELDEGDQSAEARPESLGGFDAAPAPRDPPSTGRVAAVFTTFMTCMRGFFWFEHQDCTVV